MAHLLPLRPPFWGTTGRGLSTALQGDGLATEPSLVRGRHGFAYRMASSKTLLRFLCVRAEHSRYLWALISLAQASAWS